MLQNLECQEAAFRALLRKKRKHHMSKLRIHTDKENIKGDNVKKIHDEMKEAYKSPLKQHICECFKEHNLMRKQIETLFDTLKHGDQAHQDWLKKKLLMTISAKKRKHGNEST